MKQILILIVIWMLFTASCTKKEEYGSLEITVTDALNDPITGEYVYVFDSKEELNKHIDNGTGSDKYKKTTDSDGMTFINEAEVGDYWLCCSYDNMGGGITNVTGTATVSGEQTTEVTIKP